MEKATSEAGTDHFKLKHPGYRIYIEAICTSPQIVRVAVASELALEFRIVIPAKVKLRIVRARSIRVCISYVCNERFF